MERSFAYTQPTGAHLSAEQFSVFGRVLAQLHNNGFDQQRLLPQIPQLAQEFGAACTTLDDQHRMMDELAGWVRWYRLPAYWLTYLFQLILQQKSGLLFPFACQLYAEAQINLHEDLALISYENGATALALLRAQLAGPAQDAQAGLLPAIASFEKQMRGVLGYYRRWYTTESFRFINPLTENLYNERTWRDLGQVFPALRTQPAKLTPAQYLNALAACQDAENVYTRVLLRRFLGICYHATGEYDGAVEQYSQAFNEAEAVGLDTEVGHLLRLRASGLGHSGHFEDALRDLQRAQSHESHPQCSYWAALTLAELGDAYLRKISPLIDPAHPPEQLPQALEAYQRARTMFEVRVAMGVIPIARAVMQQLFRSYADNAVQVAMLSGPSETIAQIEATGPRLSTDLIAEGNAARRRYGADYSQFRQAQAVFGQNLLLFTQSGDIDKDFSRYLDNVKLQRIERQRYLKDRVQLTAAVTRAQLSDEITKNILALRLPDTLILTVHLGAQQVVLALIDASNGQTLSAVAQWAEEERLACDQIYATSKIEAATAPTGLLRMIGMRNAISRLLEAYGKVFSSIFEQLLPLMKGKHLKIIPRFAMNEVPFHALACLGRPLIEYCDVSYAATLGVLLQGHRVEPSIGSGSLLLLRDEPRTRPYAGTLRELKVDADSQVEVLVNPSLETVAQEINTRQPLDLFFACHGHYNPDDPQASILELTATEAMPFSRLFAELDLPECRSVVLGACESGLGRTLISAESIGLPLAFLHAGARYVIASLWEVNQISTAIFTAQYYRLLRTELRNVTSACNEAQRRVMRMTQSEIQIWLRTYLPEMADKASQTIQELGETPFCDPYYWAGFYVTGDLESGGYALPLPG